MTKSPLETVNVISMPIYEEEARLLLPLLQAIPVKGVEAMEITIGLYKKLDEFIESISPHEATKEELTENGW